MVVVLLVLMFSLLLLSSSSPLVATVDQNKRSVLHCWGCGLHGGLPALVCFGPSTSQHEHHFCLQSGWQQQIMCLECR